MLEIEHFFAPVSGYAYLGHAALLDIARRSGARVRQRPVDIVSVFAEGGSTPPAKQSDVRRAWRARDMRLWATRRGLPLNERPKFWGAIRCIRQSTPLTSGRRARRVHAA